MLVTPITIKSPFRHRLTKPAAIAVLLIAVGCGGGGGDSGVGPGGGGSATVAAVAVTPTSSNLLVGVTDSANLSTTTATATPKDASGNTLSGQSITWSSTAPSVATVTSSGVITAVSAGSASITATSGGKSGSVAVTVTRPPVATFAITPASPTLLVNVVDSANLSVASLSAVPKDAAGHQLSGRVLAWSSSAPSVAAVNANGTVTGLSAGTAAINVSSEGQTGTVSVTVTRPAVANVAMSAAPPTLLTGVVDSTNLGSATVTATPTDAAGHLLSGRVVTWTSSAGSVATVTPSGVVKAISPGNATITAAIEGQAGSVAVTVVKPPVAQVSVSPLTSSIKVGAVENLSVTLLDAQSHLLTGRIIGVSNNTPAIITVSGGTVTGQAAGTGSVTYSSEGVTTTATVTVTP